MDVVTAREFTDDEEKNWRRLWMRSQSGPLPNLRNALLALRNDGVLRDCVVYDEMLAATLLTHVPLKPSNGLKPRPVTDADIGIFQEYLQEAGLRRLGQDVAHQAVDLRARERSFHPIKEYFSSIKCD